MHARIDLFHANEDHASHVFSCCRSFVPHPIVGFVFITILLSAFSIRVHKQVSDSSEVSFAVVTSAGDTKSEGVSHNIDQTAEVVYVYNPALVYGFAIGGGLIVVIGVVACIAAVAVPKCKKKNNNRVHAGQY